MNIFPYHNCEGPINSSLHKQLGVYFDYQSPTMATTVTTVTGTPTPEPPLKLELATIEDVPELVRLWYNAFSIPSLLAIWPDTPGVRQWWESAIRYDMLHKPREKYLKVVDSQTGRIAAYAKWSLETSKERGPRFPPWHPDMDARRNEEFFQRLEDVRNHLVGDGRKNFCKFAKSKVSRVSI